MMKRILKWLGYVVLAVVVLVGGVWVLGERKLAARTTPEAVAVVPIPSDPAALARGEHLARSVAGCAGCHASDLGGDPAWAVEPGLLPAPNLTPGGVGADYTTEDWVRALRHGIAADGRKLLIMPSGASAAMTDEDLGAVIAYLLSVPAVERDIPERDGKIMASLLVGAGMIPTADELAADVVPLSGFTGVDIASGEYMVAVADCAGCHGPLLDGNPPPGGPTGPDITSSSSVADWSAAEFLTFFRTATRPDGIPVSEMPIVNEYDGMTDDEIESIRLYLLSRGPDDE